MTAPQPLDRELILRAFTMMAAELRRQGVRGEILLAGGALMALSHDPTRRTRDVDGVVLAGHGAVFDAAQIVAGRLHLPRGWLNEGVSVYLSDHDDPDAAPVFDDPHLAVMGVSAAQLFALKARAARALDVEDLRILAAELAVATVEEAVAVVARFFPDDPLAERSLDVLIDLLGS